MEKSNFENLQIYQLSTQLANEVWKIASNWNNFARDTLGKQIVRAVDSIGANIAEGSGRGSAKDNSRFLKIARGSLYETRHWLFCAKDRNLLTDEQVKLLSPLIKELIPKLNSYLGMVNETAKRKN
ncbi:MAG: four helix bundle protein [Pyrinomonadaceae bacterium]